MAQLIHSFISPRGKNKKPEANLVSFISTFVYTTKRKQLRSETCQRINIQYTKTYGLNDHLMK